MAGIYIQVWYPVHIFYTVWKATIWLEHVVTITYPTLFVNKHIDTEMLYCWLIVSKLCHNVTETDICPYWAMSLDSLVYNSGTLPIELKG